MAKSRTWAKANGIAIEKPMVIDIPSTCGTSNDLSVQQDTEASKLSSP